MVSYKRMDRVNCNWTGLLWIVWTTVELANYGNCAWCNYVSNHLNNWNKMFKSQQEESNLLTKSSNNEQLTFIPKETKLPNALDW